MSKRQAIALAVLVVVVAVVLLWQPRDETLMRPAAVETRPHLSTSAPPDTEVVVAVVGQVEHPGLLHLAPGARVADALALAKPLPQAELMAVNLAEKLIDGQQLVIPAKGEAPPTPPPGAAPAAGGKLSLNRATLAELQALPGVGEKTAAAIIELRDARGGFRDIEELREVKGIGAAKFDKLKDEVTP